MTNSGHTQIPSRWLSPVRVAWVGLVVLTIVLVGAAVLPRFYALQAISPLADTWQGELNPGDANALHQLGITPVVYAAYFAVLEATAALLMFGVGLFIYLRKPDDWMVVLVSVALITFGAAASPLLDALVKSNLIWDLSVLLARVLGLGCFVAVLFLFPDGQFAPRSTRWLVYIWLVYITSWLFVPPLRFSISLVAKTPSEIGLKVWFLFFILCGTLAQIYRYIRISGPVQRQQTKWVVYGISAMAVVSVLLGLPMLLVPLLQESTPNTIAFRMVAFTVVLLGEILFAVSLAVAILRYRLWDIDVLIRRTLVYGILTAVLAGLYFGVVTLLQNLLSAVTGQQTPIIIVISTLFIAALFNPLRRRIQDMIDRRFYRQKYDAKEALAEFGLTVRDEVDLEQLSEALLAVVAETVQPESASLWLHDLTESGMRRL